jgi:hypothetical protein
MIGDDINFVFDEAALNEEGIRKDQPLSLQVNGMTLRSALSILLKDAGLMYVVEPEAITITTETRAKGPTKIVIYSVADLVVPAEDRPPVWAVETTMSGENHEEQLIRLIKRITAAPKFWSDAGGKGTIHYFPLGMALVVDQTQDVQEEIDDLLSSLRRLQEILVAVEVRLVSTAVDDFERIGVDVNIPGTFVSDFTLLACIRRIRSIPFVDGCCSCCNGPVSPECGLPTTLEAVSGITLALAFWNDSQVFTFLEAAQGDRRTNIIQMPTTTVFNWQTANIRVDKRRSGLTVSPRVFGAGSPVRLKLSSTIEPITFNTLTRVPDGGTVVIGGLPPLAEGRNEFCQPLGCRRDRRKVQILMVTTRVVTNAE